MALQGDENRKLQRFVDQEPQVTIFLQPIAPPAALGLAGFAGSTFITSAWIAGWFGNGDSPTIFFPFVFFWGGLSQFIAGLYGFRARDVLVSVINTMWGAFWMSIGLMFLLNVGVFTISWCPALADFISRLLAHYQPTTSMCIIPNLLSGSSYWRLSHGSE